MNGDPICKYFLSENCYNKPLNFDPYTFITYSTDFLWSNITF